MPNLYTIPPGTSIADAAAQRILSVTESDDRARTVIFVPTRRAAVTMRQALQAALGNEASLLPRILPLADIGQGLLTLLGSDALPLFESIPPAMSDWQQRYYLTAQVAAFLKRRHGAVTLDYALAMAEELMSLQQQCARAGVTLTQEKLRMLVAGDMATHWQQSLLFLGILVEYWPALEAELGLITPAEHEGRVLAALAEYWRDVPPDFPVWVIGSTASQESTANLLQVIAGSSDGHVILPGLDTALSEKEWAQINPGHPLYHLKHFLDRFQVAPSEVHPLNATPTRSVWMEALAGAERMPHWKEEGVPDYSNLYLIPCAQAESESRTIALLMREALETPSKHTALITPDEGLMARVAAQMKRYGITIDRLERGSLATTDSGSLWTALLTAIAEPERVLHLRSLFHHPLTGIDRSFLAQIEPKWYGVTKRRPGQLPSMHADLQANPNYAPLQAVARQLAQLTRQRHTASGWITEGKKLLMQLGAAEGAAQAAVEETLAMLIEADLLGEMRIAEFQSLFDERFSQPVRHGGVAAHPQLSMLTPVEARLQQFDRVILASMTEDVWPGITAPNAWLNLAAQAALGLPSPAHQHSLVAHDVLMFGSSAEVFLTWPLRAQGSPTTRSRYIERLVTLLATHGIDEKTITATQYTHWADSLHAAHTFQPSEPIRPLPVTEDRPRKLSASALDTLFADPFTIYAESVLRLKELDAIDADPDARDFGNLAHKAIEALTNHWNAENRPPAAGEMEAIADTALHDFSDRPSTGLFWRNRLLRALAFVDGFEAERRARSTAMQVLPEEKMETSIGLGKAGALTLVGKIDRQEKGGEGLIIGDYKTGQTPTENKILEGYATQLLAYAMLTEAEAPLAVEYWELPYGKRQGKITTVETEKLKENGLPEALKAALITMLDAKTPFLATPRQANDPYDGLSRYDEWAG